MSYHYSELQVCLREVQDLREGLRLSETRCITAPTKPATPTGGEEMASWVGYLLAGILLAFLGVIWRGCRYYFRHRRQQQPEPEPQQHPALETVPATISGSIEVAGNRAAPTHPDLVSCFLANLIFCTYYFFNYFFLKKCFI